MAKPSVKKNPKRETKSVGSHKPGGDGPGTKTFKHESDNQKRSTRRRR